MAEVRAGRRTVTISRPDKALFPSGVTKLDLARYYADVAPALLAHVRDRPLNLERYPDGIERRKLFQQEIPSYFPGWIRRVKVPKARGEVTHVVAHEPATLVYLANQATVALHAWTSRRDRLDRPDRLIVDFDPSVDDFGGVRDAARAAGELLRELGLVPYAMVSGSRGIHVVAPLRRGAAFPEVNRFARGVAAVLAARDPERLTTEFRIANRGDRTYVDVGRSRWAHTAVVPYSVRARPDAPVATPLRWAELDDDALRPDGFTVRDVPARLERDGDPWADIGRHARGLAAPARRLAALLPQG